MARDESIGLLEVGGAVSAVVSVAGDEVNQAGAQETLRGPGGRAAEAAEKRLRGYLDEAAGSDQCAEPVGRQLQMAMAFGMSEDGRDAGGAEAIEDIGQGAGGQRAGEFDEQVRLLVDGVERWRGKRALEVFRGEVEIAAGKDADGGAGGEAQFGSALLDNVEIEGKPQVGVRGGDDVGGAGLGGEANHGEGFLEGSGAVVKAGQDVAMNIDQVENLL